MRLKLLRQSTLTLFVYIGVGGTEIKLRIEKSCVTHDARVTSRLQ